MWFPIKIAKRYIFSKSNKNSVNFITLFSILALSISSAAMLIILNVFSGLEDINIRFFSNVNPEIKITSAQGKVLENTTHVAKVLDQNPGVDAFSKLIEEKVYISYQEKEHIAYLSAFDENYKKVVQIDTAFMVGNYEQLFNQKGMISSEGVASKLQLYVDPNEPAKLLMPKSGEGLINNQEEDFNKEYVYSLGVFFLNEQYNQHILASIHLAQKLLDLDQEQAYSYVVKTKDSSLDLNQIKNQLQQSLGKNYLVKTRQEQDAAFLKLMQLENLIIYLILTLGIVIASFNLAGAVAIIILNKKKEIKTLWSVGMSKSSIKQIFFSLGLQISLLALAIGLCMGTIMCFLQWKFGLVMASQFQAFPVRFTLDNYFIVCTTVVGIGFIVSYLVSRRIHLP